MINSLGLKTLLQELAKYIATKKAVTNVKTATDQFIFNIDYSILKFDTDFIVSNDTMKQ